MALFADFRARRAARRAREVFEQAGQARKDGFDRAAAVLDGRDGLAGAAWAHFAVELYNREHKTEAERAIRRALALEPGRGDALVFLAELLSESNRAADAIATYREVLRRFPQAGSEAIALARLLRAAGDFTAVRDLLAPFVHHAHEAALLLAQAHYELGAPAAVVDVLTPVVTEMRRELQGGLLGSGAQRELYAEYQEASRLYADAYASLHGREKVIESALVRGDLDARAPANYRLLGEARMSETPAWTPDPTLRSVGDSTAFGEALMAKGERARGLCHLAAAQLRQGKIDRARSLFEQARDADDRNFAAYLGLAAVLTATASDGFRGLKALPDRPAPPEIERLVLDWPALTAAERKVVALALAPAAGAVPRMVAAGAVVRLLPIDARLTDLPEMAAPPQERAEDHRCLEAITGAATEHVAASKIEELLNFAGQDDSVFAHELAHLVHFHLPEPLQEEIDELFAAALAHEHIATDYQTTNAAEFFAVAYTDFLAHEYDLPSRRPLDDEGVVEATFDFIRTLADPID